MQIPAEDARWSIITSKAMGLGEGLNVARFAVVDAKTDRLNGVLTGVNWNDEEKPGGRPTAGVSSTCY